MLYNCKFAAGLSSWAFSRLFSKRRMIHEKKTTWKSIATKNASRNTCEQTSKLTSHKISKFVHRRHGIVFIVFSMSIGSASSVIILLVWMWYRRWPWDCRPFVPTTFLIASGSTGVWAGARTRGLGHTRGWLHGGKRVVSSTALG